MFNLKGNIVLAGLCLLAMLSGCLTYQGQLDTSVPMAEQVTVVIHRPLTLESVDGNDVDAGLIGWSPVGFATINIPAGEHELGISYQSIVTNFGGYRHEISGYTTVTHEFEPGFQYSLYPYTEVLGAKTADVDLAVILELSGGFKVAIEKKKKAVSGMAATYETGVLMGVSMGPVVRVGLDVGILPFGVVVDTGKLSFGFDTTVAMGIGWRPNPLAKELAKELEDSEPAGISYPMPFDLALTGGGLFGVYLNQDNGKAFGLGLGGGYTTSFIHLLDGDRYTRNYPDINIPKGLWYIRGAVIPNRRTKFTIYFDIYLKDHLELPLLSEFGRQESDGFSIDEDDYYNFVMRHPRNWYGWGLGISTKLY
jgi:hypothetical protein